jgi:hypothetical protein
MLEKENNAFTSNYVKHDVNKSIIFIKVTPANVVQLFFLIFFLYMY